MKHELMTSFTAVHVDAIAEAWRQLDMIFLVGQAMPENAPGGGSQISEHFERWKAAIGDLAAIDQPEAENFIKATISDVKGYRDVQKYNGAESLLEQIGEFLQKVSARKDLSSIKADSLPKFNDSRTPSRSPVPRQPG